MVLLCTFIFTSPHLTPSSLSPSISPSYTLTLSPFRIFSVTILTFFRFKYWCTSCTYRDYREMCELRWIRTSLTILNPTRSLTSNFNNSILMMCGFHEILTSYFSGEKYELALQILRFVKIPDVRITWNPHIIKMLLLKLPVREHKKINYIIYLVKSQVYT